MNHAGYESHILLGQRVTVSLHEQSLCERHLVDGALIHGSLFDCDVSTGFCWNCHANGKMS